jgi:hypothetical protein
MSNPLDLISNQTATNPAFRDEQIDYNHQYYNPFAPTAAAPVAIPQAAEIPNSPPLFQTHSQTYARPPRPVQAKLYLAAACGNCARAFGAPLTCALDQTQVSPLTGCDQFYAPSEVPQ